jgi:oxalate---CoA ligase
MLGEDTASPYAVLVTPRSLGEAIAINAAANPQAPAIVAADLSTLTYGSLWHQVEHIGDALKQAGIGAQSRVGVALPDGAPLATTIAGVACHASVVPLNPRLTAAEIDALIVRLGLDAVILAEGADIPARSAALRHRACLFEVSSRAGGVELILRTPALSPANPNTSVGLDETAMILQTSGTTARPKLVPVTHRNLLSMAARLQSWFALTPSDRVLCVTPLYYAHGLKNALFVPLILGGSLACPARSSDAEFSNWLANLKPTWYSAGPTFHRSVLERARPSPSVNRQHSLRFLHSAAAPLPDAVREGLENLFGVPVLDSYGLSEAGLVAAQSMTRGGRKRGTVGKPWPGELAIRSDSGDIAEIGGPGEIVVRGQGLTQGYIDDADANRAAFIDGWFRTGDLGRIDADGFLTVVGRIKELINRGGEKIAPAEIDDALQRHPAVAEAAAFSVPHARLGEDIAAAVVLRAGAAATPLELRQFLQESLVTFKIPRRIHIIASLPKGDTGKVLRKELSRLFATPVARADISWASSLEIEIAAIWQKLLGRDEIGPNDDFFELGGDSLLAVEMLHAIERLTARTLPPSILFDASTIRQLTEILSQEGALHDRPLYQLSTGSQAPFFFFHGAFNTGGSYTKKLARLIGHDQPMFVVSPHGLDGTAIPHSLEAMAAERLPLIRDEQPHGPYRLGGYCLGGLVAFEAARLLVAAGETVEFIALIDPPTINARRSVQILLSTLALARRITGPAADHVMMRAWYDLTHADKASTVSASQLWRAWASVGRLWRDWIAKAARRSVISGDGETPNDALTKGNEYAIAMSHYRPAPLPVRTIYFESEYRAGSWARISPDLEVIKLTGDHGAVVHDPTEIAERLRAILAKPHVTPALA